MTNLEVKKSGIHGNGLFLKKKVKKGDFVTYIQGNLSTVKRELFFTKKEASMNPDWIGVSTSYWINPVTPFKYINHSCNPSCGIRGRISIYALKALKVGEEITIDYSTTESNPFWKMKCSCGSSECRKIVKSILYLPAPVFNKYYPFIPTVLRNFYMKHKHVSKLMQKPDVPIKQLKIY